MLNHIKRKQEWTENQVDVGLDVDLSHTYQQNDLVSHTYQLNDLADIHLLPIVGLSELQVPAD